MELHELLERLHWELGMINDAHDTVVISDLDIWRTAKILVDYHGLDAEQQATMRSEFARENCQQSVVTVWLRVTAAIRQLQLVYPDGAIRAR